MKRYTYTFLNRTRVVSFGPYEDQDEAKTAFQRVYGYWPEDALTEVPYITEGL
jgi:hypothetical protein